MNKLITDALKEHGDVAPTPAPIVALEKVIDGVARLRIEFWVPGPRRVVMASQVAESLQVRFPDADVTVV